jgi:hypothetical protein
VCSTFQQAISCCLYVTYMCFPHHACQLWHCVHTFLPIVLTSKQFRQMTREHQYQWPIKSFQLQRRTLFIQLVELNFYHLSLIYSIGILSKVSMHDTHTHMQIKQTSSSPFSPALFFYRTHVMTTGDFQQSAPRGFTPLNPMLLDLEIFVTLQIILWLLQRPPGWQARQQWGLKCLKS